MPKLFEKSLELQMRKLFRFSRPGPIKKDKIFFSQSVSQSFLFRRTTHGASGEDEWSRVRPGPTINDADLICVVEICELPIIGEKLLPLEFPWPNKAAGRFPLIRGGNKGHPDSVVVVSLHAVVT